MIVPNTLTTSSSTSQRKTARDGKTIRRFDLAVIGAGSGGMAAARAARADGMSVVVFEERHIGGTCVNVGCVPKKLLVHGSRFADSLEEAKSFGWTIPKASFDWETLRDTVDQEVRRLSGFHRQRLVDLGVTLVDGRASLRSDGTIDVDDGSRFSADSIIIATGARPRVPDIEGIEHALVSDDLFQLTKLPKRMAIVGGGYIAIEFASLLSRLGVKVTIFETGDRVAKGFDDDVVEALTRSMEGQGIAIRTGAKVDAIADDADGKSIRLADGTVLKGFGQILVAVGRIPNTANLGLEEAGVDVTDRGAVVVDTDGRTTRPDVYAVGDIAGAIMLTPVAVREARRSIDVVRKRIPALPQAHSIPTAVFSTPECASVGLSEAQAHDLGFAFDVRRTRFTPLASLVSGNTTKVVMKVLVEHGSGRLIGFHLFGPHASEAAQLGALAISARLTERQLHATMALHPTVAEEVIGLGLPDEPIHQAPRRREADKAA